MTIGGAGLSDLIVIDGVPIAVMPSEVSVSREPISDYQDMLDGGSVEWQRMPHFSGVADYTDRWTFGLPYRFLDETALDQLELIRVRGGVHLVTIWRVVPIVYTCLAGVQTYYLPRFRKCAPKYYSGLVVGSSTINTTNFPTTATLNDVALTVTYADGPTLSSPGAGGLVIAKDPIITGAEKDNTAIRLGDTVVDGDELIVWMIPTYQCTLRPSNVTFQNVTESHAYTFVEL